MRKRTAGLDSVRGADFTSLLDIFMILLFIVMVRQADRFRENEQMLREQSDAQNAVIADITREAADARAEAESLRSIAEGKTEAGEFFTLINVTVYSAYNERKVLLSYGGGNDYLEITLTKGSEERSMREFADSLGKAVSDADGGIVMIVFSYDSRNAYRQDIMNISSEIAAIQRKYDNIYFREKNSADKEG